MSTSASRASDPAAPPPGAPPTTGQRANRALVLFFMLAALAVATAFLVVSFGDSAPTADLRLASWRPTAAALAAQAKRDQERKAALAWGPPEETIAAAFAEYNRVEMETGADPQSVRLREAQTTLRQALQRYAGAYGVARYHALGLHLRDRFEAALAAVLEGARQTGEHPRAWIDRRPLSPEVDAWRQWAGGFLEEALRAGLIRPDGTLPEGGSHLPGLFFIVRWFTWIHPVTDYSFQLSDTELAAFWSWKAEQSERLPIVRRLELLEQVRRVQPDYPAGYVRGVLLAREDRWAEAGAAWEEWLSQHPDDERARQNLDFAREYLANRAQVVQGGR